MTAADALVELDEALGGQGAKLCFAELKDPVKDKLKRFGLFDRIGEDFFFATVGAAVDAFQARGKADWRTVRAGGSHRGANRPPPAFPAP